MGLYSTCITWKTETWQANGLNDKQHELANEKNESKIDMLCTCETNRKERDVIDANEGSLMFLSRIDE